VGYRCPARAGDAHTVIAAAAAAIVRDDDKLALPPDDSGVDDAVDAVDLGDLS
jgi:hypothetical protein